MQILGQNPRRQTPPPRTKLLYQNPPETKPPWTKPPGDKTHLDNPSPGIIVNDRGYPSMLNMNPFACVVST